MAEPPRLGSAAMDFLPPLPRGLRTKPVLSVPPRPKLFSRKCETCIFHSANRKRLAESRLRDVLEDHLERGEPLLCHMTTYGQQPELGEVMCRGFYDSYAARSAYVRDQVEAHGPDWYEEVPPPRRARD